MLERMNESLFEHLLVAKLCLKKAWCPLLDYTYEEDPTESVGSEDENLLLGKFVKKVPGCCDVNAQSVDKWLIIDDPKFNMNDNEIVIQGFMISTIHHF